jgi:hypothetical protein
MDFWDKRKERNERHLFVSRRLDLAPPITAVALIFAATWLCAWLASTALLALGLRRMPVRYVLAFVLAYICFFGFVRIWCDFAKRDPAYKNSSSNFDIPNIDGGEGCLIVLGVFALAFILSGLFWAIGGYGLLLEVAFEIAFAGTVVRGIGKQSMLGNWPKALLQRTWWIALAVMAVVVAIAGMMQSAAPDAVTMVQAYKAVKAIQPK